MTVIKNAKPTIPKNSILSALINSNSSTFNRLRCKITHYYTVDQILLSSNVLRDFPEFFAEQNEQGKMETVIYNCLIIVNSGKI